MRVPTGAMDVPMPEGPAVPMSKRKPRRGASADDRLVVRMVVDVLTGRAKMRAARRIVPVVQEDLERMKRGEGRDP